MKHLLLCTLFLSCNATIWTSESASMSEPTRLQNQTGGTGMTEKHQLYREMVNKLTEAHATSLGLQLELFQARLANYISTEMKLQTEVTNLNKRVKDIQAELETTSTKLQKSQNHARHCFQLGVITTIALGCALKWAYPLLASTARSNTN